jgi:hypothetical protein
MTDQTTVFEPVVDARQQPRGGDHPPKQSKPSGPLARLSAPALRLNASTGVWAGLGVAALGFGLIFFSWIKVAATLDVGRQLPYVVSGAMTGLGLIVVGIALIDMAVRRQDRIERRQQLALMRSILEELRDGADTTPRDRS